MLTDIFIGLLNGDHLSDLSNKDFEITTSNESTIEINNDSLRDSISSYVDGTLNSVDSASIDYIGDDSTFSAFYIENL